jgi:hypothetical protein
MVKLHLAKLRRPDDPDIFVPNKIDIRNCALRDKELMTTEAGKKLFEYYHDVILFKCAGKYHWDAKIRHHATISDAINPFTKQSAINPGMEAFAVMSFDNGENKWKYIASRHKEGKKPDRKDPRMICPYTSSKGGQQYWGGWTPEGWKMWKGLAGPIAEAREQEHVKEMEQDALQRIQRANNGASGDKKGTRQRDNDGDESDGAEEFGF